MTYFFKISSTESFRCTAFVTLVMEHWIEWEISQLVHQWSIQWPIVPWANVPPQLHLALRIDRNTLDTETLIPLWRNSICLKTQQTHFSVISSPCSTTGVTKAVVCAILSGMMHIKEPLLLIGKSSPCGCSRFHLSLSLVLYCVSDTI